jgi:hypothetical protein
MKLSVYTFVKTGLYQDYHLLDMLRHHLPLADEIIEGRRYLTAAPKFLLPSWLFDLFPHTWADPAYLPDLRTYEGPFVKAVRDNPAEFVRDRFRLYEDLKKHPQGAGA